MMTHNDMLGIIERHHESIQHLSQCEMGLEMGASRRDSCWEQWGQLQPPPRHRPLTTLLADHSPGQRAAGLNTHVALIDSIIAIAISCERGRGGRRGARQGPLPPLLLTTVRPTD